MTIPLSQFISCVSFTSYSPPAGSIYPHIAMTETNLYFLTAWAYAEGSSAHFNPWDTTTPCPGATPYNSFGPNSEYHVWNYPTKPAGIEAFLHTLAQPTLGGYGPIRAALATGHNPHVAAQAVARSAWGTEPFTPLLTSVISDPSAYTSRPVAGS